MNQKNGKIDIYIHTNFSDGLMSSEALIEYVMLETDLEVIAVMDQDTIAGARIYSPFLMPQLLRELITHQIPVRKLPSGRKAWTLMAEPAGE